MTKLWDALLLCKECVELWASKHQIIACLFLLLSFIPFIGFVSLIMVKTKFLSGKEIMEIISSGLIFPSGFGK